MVYTCSVKKHLFPTKYIYIHVGNISFAQAKKSSHLSQAANLTTSLGWLINTGSTLYMLYISSHHTRHIVHNNRWHLYVCYPYKFKIYNIYTFFHESPT